MTVPSETSRLVLTRVQKAAKAQALRDAGLSYSEIGELMGAAKSTVHAWLDDPDGSKLRARKDSYRGVCEVCGGQTDGSNGRDKAPTLCIECRTWTKEAVLDAMKRWADDHGGIPPTVIDWGHADTDHPNSRTVCLHWGWNKMLLEAGFGLKCDRRPETQAFVMVQLRAGVPVPEIAESIGVTPQAIIRRLRDRGLTLKDVA